MKKIRTRFAPSPSGYLHIGGARTALFSWLFARHHQGEFIVRMEDTDRARSTQESVDVVLKDLAWLGMDWDEGPEMDGKSSKGPHAPYFQSQRLEIYKKHLEALKAKGLVYASFDSKEEVEAEREAAIAKGMAPVNSGSVASAEEVEEKARQGVHPAWRFRMPESGTTEFPDLVHGKMKFENRLLADFVVVRADGVPTYNFAAVVDDALMGITHVIRGDDHLSNTPRQACLYRALGFEEPAFAHIPMILGPDRQRLSKRHGATAVGQYRDLGYLPEALMNYLALLGWSFDDMQTLFSVGELKEKFTLERVGKNAAVFDPVKLEWMNGQYVKSADLERVASLAWPFYADLGLVDEAQKAEKWPWFLKLITSLKQKVRSLSGLPGETEFFFLDFKAPAPEAQEAYFNAGDPRAWLEEFTIALKARQDWSPTGLEAWGREYCQGKDIKFKIFVAVIRAALTGRTVSPGLFETVELLGKEKCLQRLEAALKWGPPGR